MIAIRWVLVGILLGVTPLAAGDFGLPWAAPTLQPPTQSETFHAIHPSLLFVSNESGMAFFRYGTRISRLQVLAGGATLGLAVQTGTGADGWIAAMIGPSVDLEFGFGGAKVGLGIDYQIFPLGSLSWHYSHLWTLDMETTGVAEARKRYRGFEVRLGVFMFGVTVGYFKSDSTDHRRRYIQNIGFDFTVWRF